MTPIRLATCTIPGKIFETQLKDFQPGNAGISEDNLKNSEGFRKFPKMSESFRNKLEHILKRVEFFVTEELDVKNKE